MKRNNILLLLVVFFAFATVISGCAKSVEKYGKEISLKEITPISDIYRRSEELNGKTVRIDGKIREECPTGCWFFVKDDTGEIYVDIGSRGLAIAQHRGRSISVEGEVLQEGGNVQIVGKGVVVK